MEENENVEKIVECDPEAKESSDDSANESMEDEAPTVIEVEAATSKDPQSKEPNEQPELEDQNQNDSNAGEHADDSDWADVTNDEANTEPKKAAPSAVCISH